MSILSFIRRLVLDPFKEIKSTKKVTTSKPDIKEDVIDTSENVKPVEPPKKNKVGYLGGYVMYNPTIAGGVPKDFIEGLKELGLNYVFINTPRDKNNPDTYLSYEDWMKIFDLFSGSGIKIMLMIYETLAKKDSKGKVVYKAWTDAQIKSISTHKSFYSWQAMDEVKKDFYNNGDNWVTKYHNEVLPDGSKKWPNMNICFYPTEFYTKEENYRNYLEMYADSADLTFADMYPLIASHENNKHYEIKEDGEPFYRDFGKKLDWFTYLKLQMEFKKKHPNLTHRLYLHVCKHVSSDNSGKKFILYPKPSIKTLTIQSYANLMAGSEGLMFFLLSNIGSSWSEAAFDEKLMPNGDTFNLMKEFYHGLKFLDYMDLAVNTTPDDIVHVEGDFNENEFIKEVNKDSNLLISYSHDKGAKYCTILNLSINNTTYVTVKNNVTIFGLGAKDTKVSNVKNKRAIAPGEILVLKKDSLKLIAK